MFVEHVLANQAMDGAAGERGQSLEQWPKIGDGDPPLPDRQPAQSKSVDRHLPGGDRAGVGNRWPARRIAPVEPERRGVIVFDDADIGAGIQNEKPRPAVQCHLHQMMAGRSGPTKRDRGEAEQAQGMIDRARLARPIDRGFVRRWRNSAVAGGDENEQGGQSNTHIRQKRASAAGSLRRHRRYRRSNTGA